MRKRRFVIAVLALFFAVMGVVFLRWPRSQLKVEGTLTPEDVRYLRSIATQERARIASAVVKFNVGSLTRRLRNVAGWRSASIELVSGRHNPDGAAYVEYGDIFDRHHCYVYYFTRDEASGWRFESAQDYRK